MLIMLKIHFKLSGGGPFWRCPIVHKSADLAQILEFCVEFYLLLINGQRVTKNLNHGLVACREFLP
jgi:hypothetical protein